MIIMIRINTTILRSLRYIITELLIGSSLARGWSNLEPGHLLKASYTPVAPSTATKTPPEANTTQHLMVTEQSSRTIILGNLVM